MNKFEQLGLSESLLKAILDLGFENPTEVQRKRFPYYWKRHRYGCVGSDRDRENGSFGFPVIQKIDANNRNTQALILSPTRDFVCRLPTK
jgi:ATP-dependent RNA helicase DeaD